MIVLPSFSRIWPLLAKVSKRALIIIIKMKAETLAGNVPWAGIVDDDWGPLKLIFVYNGIREKWYTYTINMHTTVYQYWRFVYHHIQSVIDHYARISLYTLSFCTKMRLHVYHLSWPLFEFRELKITENAPWDGRWYQKLKINTLSL